MSNIYSFKRRGILLVTMLLATLAAAMTAESANAQEINTIVQQDCKKDQNLFYFLHSSC